MRAQALLALLLGATAMASLIAAHLQLSGLRIEAVSAEPVAAGTPLSLHIALSAKDGRPRRGLRLEVLKTTAYALPLTNESVVATLTLRRVAA